MVDQRLKSLYQNIEINEAELDRNRDQLADSLSSIDTSAQTDIDLPTAHDQASVRLKEKLALWTKPFIWGPVATAASLLFITLYFYQGKGLEAESLKEVERFVARHGNHEKLFAQANALKESGSRIEQLNALAVISMLGTDNSNKMASATGLVEDPRPEFRAYYLEYLLDYADEARYSVSYIEALIEKEEDEECLYLLSRLLKLALSHQDHWDLPEENAAELETHDA